MKKQATKAPAKKTALKIVKKAAPKKTAKAVSAAKKTSAKGAKKTENKILYWGLISISKKVGWLHFVFKESITEPELEAFKEHNLTRRLKATVVVISKDIYDYWVSEEVHNSLNMTDLSSEPFGFLPNRDDGIYEEILELNPGLKIK